MKATNHLGSLFFLLLLATLSFDGSAVDRLFFYFKNKIKKTSRERVLLRESKPKKGSYTACYYVYTFTMTSQASADPLISLLCFVSLCTQWTTICAWVFSFVWMKTLDIKSGCVYLHDRLLFHCLSLFVFFKTKTRINIWNEFKFTCLYCRHCCCCQLGDLDREKGLNKISERESLRHVCTLGELVRN